MNVRATVMVSLESVRNYLQGHGKDAILEMLPIDPTSQIHRVFDVVAGNANGVEVRENTMPVSLLKLSKTSEMHLIAVRNNEVRAKWFKMAAQYTMVDKAKEMVYAHVENMITVAGIDVTYDIFVKHYVAPKFWASYLTGSDILDLIHEVFWSLYAASDNQGEYLEDDMNPSFSDDTDYERGDWEY